MPTVADFDIATDLKVEMFLPFEADNLFIIGISTIGGDDQLGSSNAFVIGESLIGGDDVLWTGVLPGFAWQAFEAITVKAELSLGGSIQDSLYFQPEPGTANIVMQSFEFDPSVNKSVRPGARIRVRVDNGVVNEILFNGYMDSIDVAYGPEGDGWNSISIRAYDAHKRIVNTRVAEYDSNIFGVVVSPTEAITLAVELAGYDVDPTSDVLNHEMPPVVATDVIVNTYITDALQTGLGILWVDPLTEQVVIRDRPSVITTAPPGTFTIGNNHGDADHLCMSDISVRADGDVVFNSLRVENSNDPLEYVVLINQDSIDLYGESANDVLINVTDVTQLELWANEVFAQAPTKLVNEVETPAVDRSGTLTDAAFFTPGTLLGVNYLKAPLHINDYYTITKVRHTIDVDSWFTTMELWKEF